MNWEETHARLIECGIESDRFTKIRYSSKNLYAASLRWKDLNGAYLHEVNLSLADLVGTRLCKANLFHASLREADLYDADLRGANLTKAILTKANLTKANLTGANLTYADLRGANLTDAVMNGANLRRADLSGAKGLTNPVEWLESFKKDKLGVIVYKAIGRTDYTPAEHWIIKPGCFLTQEVNPNRTDACGCGVNFGTLEWVDINYPDSTIWRCRIRWMDLGGVVVPYNTDGKARCGRLELIDIVGE